jgi:hypothetical protein
VPSTENCSLDSSWRTCGSFQRVYKELGRDVAVEQPVPVLAEHTVASHTGSSIDNLTNHRNSRL